MEMRSSVGVERDSGKVGRSRPPTQRHKRIALRSHSHVVLSISVAGAPILLISTFVMPQLFQEGEHTTQQTVGNSVSGVQNLNDR